MTLRERFQQWFINDEDEHYEGMVETVAIEHEKIADDFAIGFTDWLFEHYNIISCYDRKELLEIYKKEKGL